MSLLLGLLTGEERDNTQASDCSISISVCIENPKCRGMSPVLRSVFQFFLINIVCVCMHRSSGSTVYLWKSVMGFGVHLCSLPCLRQGVCCFSVGYGRLAGLEHGYRHSHCVSGFVMDSGFELELS